MSRYECQRCGEACFTTNPPHLCKDLRKRLERQEAAVKIVQGILDKHAWAIEEGSTEEAALEIVKALAGRELGA